MQSSSHTMGRFLTRQTRHRPDRLWVHYCIALGVIFCLFLATHVLNRVIIERGLVATTALQRNYSQILILGEVVTEAEALAIQTEPNFVSFNKTILQLEALHRGNDAQTDRWVSDDAMRALKDDALYRNLGEFIVLARAFAASTQMSRTDAYRKLHDHYTNKGLQGALFKSAAVIKEEASAKARQFDALQRVIVAATVLVLITEALFIFWPAQRLVNETISRMHKQTRKLRASKAQLKGANAQLKHILNHHQLTGLPNRASLTNYLSKSNLVEDAGEAVVLLVGLDDFKSVNNMFGHENGDNLLIFVSKVLKDCVDYDKMVAHVGGDEFVLISDEPSAALIRRIQEALRDPFTINGRRISINASIGFLQLRGTTRQPLDILADTEFALKFAKSAGGNRAQKFTEHLRGDLDLMQKMQLELNDAIQNGEIEPWFQPQVRLSDGHLHGAEVLARWRHPTRDLISPDVFLPAAERAGLMVDLDYAIWTKAMRYACDWQDADIWRPSISLNAAPDTMADPNLIERFLLALQRSGLDANQVVVEVLETTLIDGKDNMAAINIDGLAECGIALELDDFGTGYASLSKLTQLPLSGIKLDRSLVAPLPDQAADSVVRAILALAVELGLQVVAEGVEETAQADHLTERGCGIGQGYGFGRPMSPHEFKNWLTANAKTRLQVRAGTA